MFGKHTLTQNIFKDEHQTTVTFKNTILKAYDVANRGVYSVPKELKNKAINASCISISIKEYKRILKEYE